MRANVQYIPFLVVDQLWKLDRMRWFSHRRRTGGRHNCITYLLMDVVAWLTATPATRAMLKVLFQTFTARRAPENRAPEDRSRKMPHFVVFFVSGDLDLWPLTPNSNSGEIFVHFT